MGGIFHVWKAAPAPPVFGKHLVHGEELILGPELTKQLHEWGILGKNNPKQATIIILRITALLEQTWWCSGRGERCLAGDPEGLWAWV